MRGHVKFDKNVLHLKTLSDSSRWYHLSAWYIRNFSSVKSFSTTGFEEKNKYGHYNIRLQITPYTGGVKIEIISNYIELSQWKISVSTPSGIVPFIKQNVSNKDYCASIEGEDFQKLKELPDNKSLIVCQMIYYYCYETIPFRTPEINSEYLNSLKSDLRKYSGASSRETVNLRIGEEIETVNKAVLCVRSPVFAKMFGNDMREQNQNTITITDIKMPVLKALVSFLYSGVVADFDFDFSCALYYAADKYDIEELQLVCIKLLLSKTLLAKVYPENLFKLLKMSLTHSDELLKSAAMTMISGYRKELISTSDWKLMMNDDPELALDASTFFDLE